MEENTGAGGANVWTHGLLKALLDVPPADSGLPYEALPKGANMRVSIRRSLRVGAQSGAPVEDLGVVPDELHRMTRDDVLNDNVDLLDHAGGLLAAAPVHKLVVRASVSGGNLDVELDSTNVDRADVYVDDRPRASVDLVAAGSVDL